jgi:hypothetical protein
MAVPPNPLTINPLYASIILENRGVPQNVLSRVNFLGLRYGLSCNTFRIISNDGGFTFFNPTNNLIIVLQRESLVDNDSILVVLRNGGGLPLVFLRTENVFVNILNSAVARSTLLIIPNSLTIKTQGGAPKLPPEITIVQQGQVYLIDTTRIIFAYQFDPGQPNIIRFNLANLNNPNCMIFVRNRLGTEDLPVQVDIDANRFLTITGIPIDATVPGVCSAMLMII